MGVQQTALILLVLVGIWVTSCHGWESWNPAGLNMRLTGTGFKCLGLLEINLTGNWERVCHQLWDQKFTKMVCNQLDCDSFFFSEVIKFNSGQKPMGRRKMNCLSNVPDLKLCSWVKSNCTEEVIMICKEKQNITTAPPTTSSPTATEPPGPPRLRLADGRFNCSGTVELYMGGQWGTVQSRPENKSELASWVCRNVGCGEALDEAKWPSITKDERPHLPVRWEMMASCRGDSLPDCFNRTSISRNKIPASVLCSGSQPRVMQRLVDSWSSCEGILEVFHNERWEVLCDSSSLMKSRGVQICQELRCGNFSSITQIQDTKVSGVSCSTNQLQKCLSFQKTQCFKTRVTCHPRSAAVGAGTIVSILLALILLGVLLVICGPPAYKKLQKKYTKKKQRQWIGPTGLQQNVSFHRNSTVTLRPRQEVQGAQGQDNDYSQTPKKNSYLSAYPALEGAIRSSNPPDNSSDSDYDLHSARRL
nr:T-cell surface glycoprotein CD5 [Pelodiscus sinensis]|eukprot:XP_006110343.2 T-cell surface glycoprotein CD5 [Pelodiscus sinensis]